MHRPRSEMRRLSRGGIVSVAGKSEEETGMNRRRHIQKARGDNKPPPGNCHNALTQELHSSVASPASLYLVMGYVVLVLGIDALASLHCSWPFDWSVFHWRVDTPWHMLSLVPPDWTRLRGIRSFDLYKFLLWFVVPFCCSLRHMEWSWFSIRTWKRRDWMLLLLMILVGGVAVLSIQVFPSLKQQYPGLGHLPLQERFLRGLAALSWTASWLMGWEFLHRYVLLRAAARKFPRFGWFIVPVSEVVYHLQKPPLEAVGMAVFSVLLTWWSLKRRNLLLPFIAHLFVEVFLIAALAFLL